MTIFGKLWKNDRRNDGREMNITMRKVKKQKLTTLWRHTTTVRTCWSDTKASCDRMKETTLTQNLCRFGVDTTLMWVDDSTNHLLKDWSDSMIGWIIWVIADWFASTQITKCTSSWLVTRDRHSTHLLHRPRRGRPRSPSLCSNRGLKYRRVLVGKVGQNLISF